MISKVSSNDNGFSPVSTAAKGAVAGVAATGIYKAGAKIIPVAKDSFSTSIKAQQAILDNLDKAIPESMERADKVAEFISHRKSALGKLTDPKGLFKNIHDNYEHITQNFYDRYSEVVTKGVKQAQKEIAAEEKLLLKGKPSKLKAVKDTAVDLAEKVADKTKSVGKGISEAFSNIKTQKFEYIKTNKEGILKTAKKVGIPALIGAATLTAFTLIKNKVSKDN